MEDERSHKFYEEYINELHEQRRKSGKNAESVIGEESDIFITKNVEIFGGDSAGICGSCNQGRGIRVIMDFMERDLEGEVQRRAEDQVVLHSSFGSYLIV